MKVAGPTPGPVIFAVTLRICPRWKRNKPSKLWLNRLDPGCFYLPRVVGSAAVKYAEKGLMLGVNV